ncbi:hypothetical protein V5O48_014549 [Marasmius crinis-equi]|uniref:Uncharacterized protein n=1 Tax=Marasmius crinis-equi TaxID=585013 RepID=A0ABR3EX20_9AGAR
MSLDINDKVFCLVSTSHRPSEDVFQCLACPKFPNSYLEYERKNLKRHIVSQKHEENEAKFLAELARAAPSSSDVNPAQTSRDDIPHESNNLDFGNPPPDDQCPFSDLWTPIDREIHIPFEPHPEDYYHAYLRELETEEVISCHMFLTHLLFNGNSRLRYSESQKKAILSWGKSLGAREVPALSALKRVQDKIQDMVASPTEKVVSSSGTVFYINEIGHAIAKDFANPITRLAMTEYPEDGGGSMSELKHGWKWLIETPRDMLTITARVGGKLYFVGELLQCRDGSYFIPDRFFTKAVTSDPVTPGKPTSPPSLFAFGNVAQITLNGFVVKSQPSIICTDQFCATYEDLLHAGHLSRGFSDCSRVFAACMPHPRREQARGRMVYGVPLIIFLDDAGKPRTPQNTAGHIHEMFRLSTQTGAQTKIKAYKEQTGVNDSTNAAAMQSIVELGKVLYDKTHLENTGLKREDIERQLQEEVARAIDTHGINPLIGMPAVDMHQDTPTEILHTVLLGVVKYFWGQTVHILDKAKLLQTFEIRLASVNTSAMNIPKISAEYICTYKGSLIGKHFKSLAQLMPFLIYDIVPKKVVDAWTIIGELVVLIWHTEIGNLESYLSDLSHTIEAFLNITAECSPSILISKPKFHFLVHLPAHIQRFGPALIFSTERYKSFNHVFRLTCIHSNRQAPSRDSCKTFATHDITKHIVTGGYWHDKAAKCWVQAGPFIHSYMEGNKLYSRLLVVPDIEGKASSASGRVRYRTSKEDGVDASVSALAWSRTEASSASNASDFAALAEGQEFLSAIAVAARNGDEVRNNMFAAVRWQDQGEKLFVGRLKEVLAVRNTPSTAKMVQVEMFDFLPEPHGLLRVPVLKPRLTENDRHQKIIVTPENVMCGLNVQHDCATVKCSQYKTVPIAQERIEISRTRPVVDHNDDDQFLLNTHTLHNHLFIPKILPNYLLSVLSRPQLQAEEQKTLRLRAAQHVRTQKEAQDSPEDGQIPTENAPFELRPFERGRGRGRGKGVGRGAGQSISQGAIQLPANELGVLPAPSTQVESEPSMSADPTQITVPVLPAKKKKRGSRTATTSTSTRGGVTKRGRGKGRGQTSKSGDPS